MTAAGVVTRDTRSRPFLIGLLSLYLVAAIVLLIGFLVPFWESAVGLPADGSGEVAYLWFHISFRGDSAFLVMSLVGGAIGGTVHGIASLSAHAGKVDLQPGWTVWYLTNPLVGGALSLFFVLILQAGLLNAAGAGESPKLSGVAAISVLGGLFTRHALASLKRIFDVVFQPDEQTRPRTNP